MIVLNRRRTRQTETSRLLMLLNKAGEQGLANNINYQLRLSVSHVSIHLSSMPFTVRPAGIIGRTWSGGIVFAGGFGGTRRRACSPRTWR